MPPSRSKYWQFFRTPNGQVRRYQAGKGALFVSKKEAAAYEQWEAQHAADIYYVERGGRRLRYRHGVGSPKQIYAPRAANLAYLEDVTGFQQQGKQLFLDRVEWAIDSLIDLGLDYGVKPDMEFNAEDWWPADRLVMRTIDAFRVWPDDTVKKGYFLTYESWGPNISSVRSFAQELISAAELHAADDGPMAFSTPIPWRFKMGIEISQRELERRVAEDRLTRRRELAKKKKAQLQAEGYLQRPR